MTISDMKLIDINLLLPHEDVDEANLAFLTKEISKKGVWSDPIIIDKDSGIIMDGHHRYTFALASGFYRVPCYEMSYSSQQVKVYDRESGQPFAHQKIFKFVESGRTFPAKTTRHEFSEQFDSVEVELARLYQAADDVD